MLHFLLRQVVGIGALAQQVPSEPREPFALAEQCLEVRVEGRGGVHRIAGAVVPRVGRDDAPAGP